MIRLRIGLMLEFNGLVIGADGRVWVHVRHWKITDNKWMWLERSTLD